MRDRLVSQPDDLAASLGLAAVLIRRARVDSDAGLAIEAEQIVRRALEWAPSDYSARQMLAAVLLSQHRFRDAIAVADGTRREQPRDPWN
tara:strand:+ start:178 stop:447 length:270 start_codon:yes stop_codon:yes gene_type:complete